MLNTIWFLLVGFLFAGYAILDGFDLGVGALSLFNKDEKRQRIFMNVIGPVWDGNEVWLITAGGALFAAFPAVYATVFEGFYIAMYLVLLALIFRACAMEFRHRVESPRAKRFWDWAFGLGSLVAALLFGVAYGNILRGLPINENHEYVGGFFGLLNPFSLLVGVMTLVMFMMHGAIYMVAKSEGLMQDRMRKSALGAWLVFLILYVVATIWAAFTARYLFRDLFDNPFVWLLILGVVALALALPFLVITPRRSLAAFLCSAGLIAGAFGLSGASMYPRLAPSRIDLDYSLTVTNAASSERTLTVMLVIALIGMPLVLAYTIFIYHAFKGKVELGPDSY